MRISDWSSDVCSSDLLFGPAAAGLEELRVKESDRITTMVEGLRLIGAKVEELEDGLIIEGRGGDPLPGGGPIATKLDHRIAMSRSEESRVGKGGVRTSRSRWGPDN